MLSDEQAVESQLGRPPRGTWKTARRCVCGLPQVIMTHPRLEDGTPFPTLWWLTCKTLSVGVSKLESNGWMARFNEELRGNRGLIDDVEQATEAYLSARDDLEVLEDRTHPGGGPLKVRCLHAHTAQHLACWNNPVGRAVLEELSWSDPESGCI